MWADGMVWRNPPLTERVQGRALLVTTGAETDYWRETFYGFTHDNGHHLTRPGGDSFTAELFFSAAYEAQYDQAGLMLWADAANWVKTGIEWVNGQAHVACVVTLGKSDWSQMPISLPAEGLRLRVHRQSDAIWVQFWTGEIWRMVRLAYFPQGLPADVGPMACSPSRAGLEVTFHDFTLGPLLSEKAY
jgi:uncharacterized protein